MSNENILRLAKEYKIENENIYSLNGRFKDFIDSIHLVQFQLDSSCQKNSIKHKMNQPLVFIMFKNEEQITCLNNCYAGGFPNLNWNNGQVLETFPPISTASTDSLISFTDLKRFIDPVQEIKPPKSHSIVVVFWNYFAGRQANRFIKAILKNRELSREPIDYYFVNNDSYLFNIL